MSRQTDFINYLKPYAQAAEAKYGIDWRIIVAQASLETGWGSTQSRNPFNLWGMRFTGPAGSDPEGYALFSDQWQAVESYIYNLKKHHPTAWNVRNDPEKFFQEIQSRETPNTGAWAEDPQYTAKLNQIFSTYFQNETTAVDPTKPPQDTVNTPPVYFPQTYKKLQQYRDKKGASQQQKRYYVKVQHLDADEEPRNALTMKVTPDSQLIIVREKILPNTPNNSTSSSGGEYSNVDKKFQVENSGSVQLQLDGVLLDYHDNGGNQNQNQQKVTDQVQLRTDYLALLRIKEGKKKKSESVILTDDLVQIEVNNDEKKSRIEIAPQKILLKNSENDYIRIEKDTIQAKNKTESQIFIKKDLIVAENKTGTQVYMRGDLARMRCKSGSIVEVTDDRITIKDVSGAKIILHGGDISILAPGTLSLEASTIRINGGMVYINS